MTAIDNWIERALNRHKNWNPEPTLETRMCLGNVSKVFKGQLGSDRIRQICEDPKCVVEKHSGGIRDCRWESFECDGEISRKYLNGLFEGPLIAAFHENNKERGLHSAKVTLNDGNNDIMVGAMRGTCNAGVVHEPVRGDCEKCHHLDRWHGELEGAVRIREMEGETFYLLASYAIDLEFNDDRDRARFVGTLEGMLVRNCRKYG